MPDPKVYPHYQPEFNMPFAPTGLTLSFTETNQNAKKFGGVSVSIQLVLLGADND